MLNAKKVILNLFYAFLFVSFVGGCEQQPGETEPGDGASDVIAIQVWAHAGQAPERQVLESQVLRFNQQSDRVHIELTFIPERDYNAQVQAAALANDLPDILEFDGPYLNNYIWQNQLRPLDELLPAQLINDLLPSIVDQGTHAGHLYSVGVFDSGLGLYARRSALENVQVRIPSGAADAWSINEFNEVLSRLSQQDADQAVLDLKLNYRGEWFTYGFSPILQSAGADLIDRADYQKSAGVLNNAHAIAALQHVQDWIQQERVDPNLDDAAFISGRVALSWVGHWEYARYKQTWQDDLIILPLPDFGQGSKTGQGSWNWGITRHSGHPQAAVEFISFLLHTEQVLAMSDANGAVPGTRSAVQQSARYSAGGALHLFSDQLIQGISVPRPKTPGYPVITAAFQQAFQEIRNGANVKRALDSAVMTIDQDIRDNQGYPFMSR